MRGALGDCGAPALAPLLFGAWRLVCAALLYPAALAATLVASPSPRTDRTRPAAPYRPDAPRPRASYRPDAPPQLSLAEARDLEDGRFPDAALATLAKRWAALRAAAGGAEEIPAEALPALLSDLQCVRPATARARGGAHTAAEPRAFGAFGARAAAE